MKNSGLLLNGGILILVLSFNMSGFAQTSPEIEFLINKKKKFENLIESYKDSIVIIENQIKKIEFEAYKNNISTKGGFEVILKKDSKLKKEPEVLSDILFTTTDTSTFFMIDYENIYVKVILENSFAWVHESWIINQSDLPAFKNFIKEEKKRIEEEIKQKERTAREKLKKEENARLELIKKEDRAKLVAKYGEQQVQKMENGYVWIGMTEEMAIISWGKPLDINQTIYSDGSISKQYVYSDNSYLYFENGKLVTIQN